MAERRFTLEEANALLGEVAPILEKLREANAVMSRRLDEVRSAATGNGGGPGGKEFLEATMAAGSAIERLGEMGVIVRDPASGLVDFPSERDGREVYLCWRLGEGDRIEWWHPPETGVAGRRRL